MTDDIQRTAEGRRLAEAPTRDADWRLWGTYLPARQWGTVREDYSEGGEVWTSFGYDDARRRAYRWGEDGLLGWCDQQCRLCLAPALWNGKDDHLKERLFGLTGPEGNHGEDVKELYYYLDATPTHSYAKARYRYPHAAFPYKLLRERNEGRDTSQAELEILDTGVFEDNAFFDLDVEYAKADPHTTLVRYTVRNRGRSKAKLSLLAQVWYRNVWSWGRTTGEYGARPELHQSEAGGLGSSHPTLGEVSVFARTCPDEVLFTENETEGRFRKDAFHRYLVEGQKDAVNPEASGSKAALVYHLELGGESTQHFDLVLRTGEHSFDFAGFENTLQARRREAEEFYQALNPGLDGADRKTWRQAYAGLLFSKVFYHYAVKEWLDGDPARQPVPAPGERGRNRNWKHLSNKDIVLVPDTWEYPWYAIWDSAFHACSMARLDGAFAKEQLLLFLRETYMHPNGQLPAYELDFSQISPPVHAWACLRVYQATGANDRLFLERAFHKLMLNFTWWLGRNDADGSNPMCGGFLGLDNIGPFDRNAFPEKLGRLNQADGTAWVGFFSLRMLQIALILAQENEAYQDVAGKFFEHFVAIADFLNADTEHGLWHHDDQFYYDFVMRDEQESIPLRVRSLVGLLPLIGVEIIEREKLEALPVFKRRMERYLHSQHNLQEEYRYGERDGRILLSLAPPCRVRALLRCLFDEEEFLSAHGVRSLSMRHKKHPFTLNHGEEKVHIGYEPGESQTAMMGGNSNWRGPIWFPMNYLLMDALMCYHSFYGGELRVELPTNSGNQVGLDAAVHELRKRLTGLLRPGRDGKIPALPKLSTRAPAKIWGEGLLFHEYFHGDTGKGLGSSHQTGWTALVAACLESLAGQPALETCGVKD